MTPSTQASPSVSARIIHLALVAGVLLFLAVVWWIGRERSVPTEALPDRKVLYIAVFLVSAASFSAALFFCNRLDSRAPTETTDDWWRRNQGRAMIIWALVEGPALFGIVGYLLTGDFRVLVATVAGLFLFAHFSPARLVERA